MYICSPRCVGAAPLLEPPERVAVREVGGAPVGRRGRLGIRDKRTREVAVPVPRSRRVPGVDSLLDSTDTAQYESKSSRISHAWSMRARPRCRSRSASSRACAMVPIREAQIAANCRRWNFGAFEKAYIPVNATSAGVSAAQTMPTKNIIAPRFAQRAPSSAYWRVLRTE